MPIVVQRLDSPTVRKCVEGGYSPLVRCEACGSEIAKPEAGVVAWDSGENVTYVSPDFLHEGCLESHLGTTDARLSVDPLRNFLESLERYLPEADG